MNVSGTKNGFQEQNAILKFHMNLKSFGSEILRIISSIKHCRRVDLLAIILAQQTSEFVRTI